MLTSLLVGLALAQEPYVHALPVKRDHMAKADRLAARERVTALLTDVEKAYLEGDFARAEPSAWMAAELAIRAFGDQGDLTITALNDLGSVLDATGDYEVAGVALQRSLDARLALYGLANPATALAYANLGEHNKQIGDYAAARFDLEQAGVIARALQGENSVEAVVYATHLASVLGYVGADNDQKAILDWCLAVQEQWSRWKTPETAQCASDLGTFLVDHGDLVMGRIRSEQGLALAEVAYGEEHPAIALFALALAKSRETEGRFVEANQLLERALNLQELAYGADSPFLASTLAAHASVAIQLGRFSDADQDSARAIELIVAAFGPEHPDLADLYSGRGFVLAELGDIPGALAAYDAAAAIPTPTMPAGAVNVQVGRGLALMLAGRLPEATATFARTWEDAKASLGPDDPVTLNVLQNLATAEYQAGLLPEARAHIEALLAATEMQAGAAPLEAGRRLNAAGAILGTTGDLGLAKALLGRALVLQETALGAEHPDVAVTLNNRCGLKLQEADYVGARQDCDRALVIATEALGPDHPNVAEILGNRAATFASLGDLKAAEADARRALAIDEATLGPDAPDVAEARVALAQLVGRAGGEAALDDVRAAITTLTKAYRPGDWRLATPHVALGDLLMGANQYELAAAEYEAALDLYASEPESHLVDSAVVSMRVGVLRTMQGRYDDAAKALEGAERVVTPIGGAMLGDVLLARARLADVSGKPAEASALARRALDIERYDVTQLMDAVSERERRAVVASHRQALDLWLSFGAEDVEAQWGAVMDWKGLAARAASSTRAAGSPEEADLRLLRAQISHLAYDQDATGRTERLLALTDQKSRLERSAAARQTGAPAEVFEPKAICGSLPPGTAIVDVLRSTYVNGDYALPHYFAFIAERADGACTVTRVDLGTADVVDKAIERWRSLIAADVSTSRIDAQGTALRKALWDPIARTTTASTVWLVPDGAIATVPFAGLPIGGGRYLLHERTLGYLDHASDVLRTPARASGGALVVGGVDFGQGTPSAGSCVSSLADLPGTAAEADAVSRSLATAGVDVTRLGGRDATEARVRTSLSGLRVAHIATHGFFASSSCRTASADTRAISMGLADTDLLGGFDPMVLSGLALAGANARDDRGGDDGLLTAEELVNVDLNGTDLVVLSACESGLGEIAEGDGVLGLRRGFASAGADGVVMSMWAVDDAVTMRLMELFYDHLLGEEPMSAAEALRQAELTVMAEQRAATGEARPQDWAPFIASGPGTLR